MDYHQGKIQYIIKIIGDIGEESEALCSAIFEIRKVVDNKYEAQNDKFYRISQRMAETSGFSSGERKNGCFAQALLSDLPRFKGPNRGQQISDDNLNLYKSINEQAVNLISSAAYKSAKEAISYNNKLEIEQKEQKKTMLKEKLSQMIKENERLEKIYGEQMENIKRLYGRQEK